MSVWRREIQANALSGRHVGVITEFTTRMPRGVVSVNVMGEIRQVYHTSSSVILSLANHEEDEASGLDEFTLTPNDFVIIHE